jgi:amino acid adenylation domain-containing protein
LDRYLERTVAGAYPRTRAAMLQYQERYFRKLVRYVWHRSAFYREYYTSHGVKEKNLSEIFIADLPLLPKKTFIDNFDRAVTDPRLRKKRLEQWLAGHRIADDAFCLDTIVIHGSGTSGDMGIFAYDRGAWAIADASAATHLPQPENYPNGKTKVAFYVATNGHIATVAVANSMPRNIYDTLICPLLNNVERTARELSDFQPHRLVGYSSSVASLAELALNGSLCIRPQRVFVSGDKLTPSMEQRIRAAWDAPVYNFYSASESKFIAIKTPKREEMRVLDDLNIVEVLDEQDQPVGPGKEGRVVLTNLYNYTLPILRYELGDYVVKGPEPRDAPYSTLLDIRGRVNDALPVMLSSGALASIHPIVLTAFFVASVERLQFVSEGPEHVRIDYVGPRDIDADIVRRFQRVLDAKDAAGTTVTVRNVPAIESDPKTGKLRLVRLESGKTKPTYQVREYGGTEAKPSQSRIKARPSFVPFSREDAAGSIPARFEKQVERFGDRLAVRAGDHRLTYAELNRAANRIAHAIIDRIGVGPGLVALFLPPGASAVAVILGILKAGKCYVPLERDDPAARTGAIWEESETALLLCDSANLQPALAFAHDSDRVLNIDLLDSGLPVGNPNLAIASDAPAQLFYTSGSTGKPKGVVHNHRNLLHHTMTQTNALKIDCDDRATQLFSHGFSASRLDIFGALLNGAALFPICTTQEGMGRLADLLVEAEITILHWVPSAFRYFARALGDRQHFASVRLLMLAGEPMTAREVELYRRHFSSESVLVNRYAATETGIICWYVLNRQTVLPEGPVPIGYPVEETEVLLLDDAGTPVGRGEIGEIAVESSYLSPGYWNRPELTAEVFSPIPGEPGKMIYRTGDLGRLLEDDCLLHLGRKDFRVKVRGHRVECAEVEQALLEYSGINTAVAAVRQDRNKNDYLVAYYVSDTEPAPAPEALRHHLSSRLPSYMIPTAFVALDKIPLTPGGKIDRAALPEPDQPGTDRAAPAVKPHDSVESAVLNIWRRVLDIELVGIHDNFFDLGGHSLHAMMILSAAAKAFNVQLSIRDFFDAPTIADMAAALISLSHTESHLVAEVERLESMSDEEVIASLQSRK